MKIIITFFVVTLSVCSCDFIRSVLSKPTSKDIEAKRAYIENQKMLENSPKVTVEDTIEVKITQESKVDSTAIKDSIRYSSSKLVAEKELSKESKDTLVYKYYVIVATFGQAENATKYAKTLKNQGIEAYPIAYLNGFTAIGICPSNNIEQAYNDMEKMRSDKFPDAWVLHNKIK